MRRRRRFAAFAAFIAPALGRFPSTFVIATAPGTEVPLTSDIAAAPATELFPLMSGIARVPGGCVGLAPATTPREDPR